MTTAVQYSAAENAARADLIVTALDLGGGQEIRLLTGSKPANCAAAQTGTLLGTIALNTPSFNQSGGDLNINTTTPLTTTAIASGTAGYCRFYNNAGTCVIQGDVGVTGSTNFLELDTVTVNTGDTWNVTAGGQIIGANK
jgi:hypothetical protein